MASKREWHPVNADCGESVYWRRHAGRDFHLIVERDAEQKWQWAINSNTGKGRGANVLEKGATVSAAAARRAADNAAAMIEGAYVWCQDKERWV